MTRSLSRGLCVLLSIVVLVSNGLVLRRPHVLKHFVFVRRTRVSSMALSSRLCTRQRPSTVLCSLGADSVNAARSSETLAGEVPSYLSLGNIAPPEPDRPQKFQPYDVRELSETRQVPPLEVSNAVIYNAATNTFHFRDSKLPIDEMMSQLAADLMIDENDTESSSSEHLVTYEIDSLVDLPLNTTDISRRMKTLSEKVGDLMQLNTTVQLLEKSSDHQQRSLDDESNTELAKNKEDLVFVTEQELHRLMLRHRSFVRSSELDGLQADPLNAETYSSDEPVDLQQALLLVSDEYDMAFQPVVSQSSLEEESVPEDSHESFSESVVFNATAATAAAAADDNSDEEESGTVIDERHQQLFVTEDELRSLWAEKSSFVFLNESSSDADFDMQRSLLLLDAGSEDAFDTLDWNGLTRTELDLLGEDVDWGQSLAAINDNDDDDNEAIVFRDCLANCEEFALLRTSNYTRYEEIRDAIEMTHDDLDAFEEDLNAWPHPVRSLSPSVEVQHTPDVMRSALHSMRKIPMSSTNSKLSHFQAKYGENFAKGLEMTNSMRGAEILEHDNGTLLTPLAEESKDTTDYSIDPPIWSYWNIPMEDQPQSDEVIRALFKNASQRIAVTGRSFWPTMADSPLDDRLQDFERIPDDPPSNDVTDSHPYYNEEYKYWKDKFPIPDADSGDTEEDEDEDEAEPQDSDIASVTSLDVLFNELHDEILRGTATPRVDNELFRSPRLVVINTSVNTMIDDQVQPFRVDNWADVPLFDVSRVPVSEFVYDCYARQEQESLDEDALEDNDLDVLSCIDPSSKDSWISKDGFDYSDIIQTMRTVNASKKITDKIFLNTQEFDEREDESRAAHRFLSKRLAEGANVTYPVKQPIPRAWTPDIDRGIVYTDELIEMKHKKMLLPFDDDMLLQDDVFTPNDKVRQANMIGTIREQYDWTPDKSLVHEIEPHKLERIAPIVRFVNYAARLKSTKNNVLVFDFMSKRVRHIIGLRATMLQLARKHCPEIRDIRLESEEMFDVFDLG